jgi:hypothetical protein
LIDGYAGKYLLYDAWHVISDDENKLWWTPL